jgi:hypothetical protein
MKLTEWITVTIGALIFLLMTGIGTASEPKQKVQLGDTEKVWDAVFSGNITDDFERIKLAVNQGNNQVQTYLDQEWEDIKTYQKENWQKGKDQLARNKEQIKGLWNRIIGGSNRD